MAGPGMLSISRTDKYCTKVADEIMNLRDEKALMDFKIHIKDDVIPCQKFVMAIHSPMLRAMLTSDMAEVAKQEIRLDHLDMEIMRMILDFMYCENVSFHKDQLMALIAAADYLQMTDLKEMCLDEVPGILESGNVIKWWKEAQKMNYSYIKFHCEDIMAADFDHISQQTDFLNLDLIEIQGYTSEICHDKVEMDSVLDATMRWVNNEEERVTHMEGLLHKIQLTACSADGIKTALQIHESLLDKMPMVYKLLSNTLADIKTDSSKALTQMFILVGGQDGDEVNRICWKHDKSGFETFCEISNDDISCKSSVCKIPQGFAVTGGFASDCCVAFIASLKMWCKLQNLQTRRQGHGSICVSGVLYVLGGFQNGSTVNSNSVDSMKIGDGPWQNEPDLPFGVKFPKVADVDDTLFLLDSEATNKLLCLDVAEKTWIEQESLPFEEHYAGLSVTSAWGRLYAAGGRRRMCAWYDPATNTWCMGQQPLQKHKYGALVCHNDRLFLLGGNFQGCDGEVEEYDMEEDTWMVCSYKMPRKLRHHYAFVVDIPPKL